MAKHINNPVVTIDGDDFTNYFRSCTISAEFESVDVTGFGSSFSEMIPGIGTATIELEAFQNFDSNGLDQNLWPIFANKTTVEVTVKALPGTISATNPEYSLPAAKLLTYSPVAGAVGEASTMTLTFTNAGQLGLVRSFT